eukprot:m.276331 g.276331  ORF g.276331 m.276331 type:complete len:56 (-) comp123299_c0_seq1:131-298(-)
MNNRKHNTNDTCNAHLKMTTTMLRTRPTITPPTTKTTKNNVFNNIITKRRRPTSV